MSDIEVYSTDPGREVRTSRGSVINVIRETQRSPDASVGVSVLGVIGSPANDRGVPNVPVVLSGIQDIFARWGGFKAAVGDGSASGYNGNVAALLYKLLARRVVFQPVDMALKDLSVSNLAAVNKLVTVARGGKSFTVANAGDLFTATAHGFVANDTLQLVTLTGGAGVAVATTYHVIAGGLAANAFQLALTQGGAAIVITSDGSGTLRPIAKATPALDAYTLPAGTQIQSSGGFIVRTLEDVDWAENVFTAQTVRVAKVSGTVVDLAGVNDFVETLTDTSVITATATSAAPDDTDAAETLLRYEAAMAAFNVNNAGTSANVLISDRTEAGINDALSAHCSESTSQGIFRICVVAPPVGTTVVEAEATSGDGVGRTSLVAEYAVYVHPGFRRRFPIDADNLSATDDYKATFPGQALLAAKMLNVRPEENPAYVEAEPFATYGVAELESALTRAEKVTHWQAGIATAVFDRDGGRRVGAYRDGIMADGTKIARKRLVDFLSASIIERATPWHKRLASVANQQGCFDSVDTFLTDLAGSRDQRISGHELTLSFDGETEELTIQADVVELGNMDIITIKIGVTASGFSVLGESEV